MNNQYHGFYPATILSYDKKARTAKITVEPITNGLSDGITATFAYPVGHDDRDTELEILEGAECYVFFNQGDPYSPVIWSYRSHGTGAVTDYRRIRQQNIELLAQNNIKLEAVTVDIYADVKIHGNVEIVGDQTIEGNNNISGNSEVSGHSILAGGANIGDIEFGTHVHGNSPIPS